MTAASIRERAEAREEETLSLSAAKSREAQRLKPEEPCPFRTAYQRDRDRIIHSKAFRRLAFKTQVFINPAGDHYRTRLTHTLEVSQIARTLANALNLNEDLAEAISLGHDLGHTPFGHSGERVLDRLQPGGFHHQVQSLRIVDHLAKDGQGLNLTLAVRDGIVRHSKGLGPIFAENGEGPSTLEGQVVRVSDLIAYLAHDLDDAIRAGILTEADVPSRLARVFGPRGSVRIRAMVDDLLRHSLGEDAAEIRGAGRPPDKSPACRAEPAGLRFSPHMLGAMNEMRDFLYRRVYRHPRLEASLAKADRIIEGLYQCFTDDPGLLTEYYPAAANSPDRAAADFISGMTDRFALKTYQDIFWPQCWPAEGRHGID